MMFSENKGQSNLNHQREVAQSLLKTGSREDAIRFCRENHWDGILKALMTMDAR